PRELGSTTSAAQSTYRGHRDFCSAARHCSLQLQRLDAGFQEVSQLPDLQQRALEAEDPVPPDALAYRRASGSKFLHVERGSVLLSTNLSPFADGVFRSI